jgi:Ni,Fe-hydrogenase III small subunit
MMRRSLGIRHLSCGSCNGCEHELNTLVSSYYDITQEGWDFVASPRHADVVTVTGPMTESMREAGDATIAAVPQPFIVLAIGDCAAGQGAWSGASCAGKGAGVELNAAVTVRGCPPTPDAMKDGLREAARKLSGPRAGR